MARLALVVLGIALAAALALWLLQPAPPPSVPPKPLPTATVPPTAATQSAPSSPPRFRLAGVASGGANAYAAIEDPNGVSALYRVGDEVTGLGRVAGITPQEVLLSTENGPLTLRVRPAPTKTPAPATARPTTAEPTASQRVSRRRTARPPAADDSAPESPP